MKHIKWVVFILIAIFAIIVISENIAVLRTSVEFGLNLWVVEYHTPSIPLGVLVVIAFLLGILSMAFCGLIERFRLKKQVRSLQTENREMDKKLDSLRNYPVSTDTINLE